jgi:diadenosine tetraphosphate (Ap4A) HIT family hydrolase
MKAVTDHTPDCLFCKWVAEGKAVETNNTMAAFYDGYPVTPGHLLIVPKRHVADGLALTREEIHDSEALIRRLADRIRKEDPAVTGFNIGINIGESAGQTVMHAHIHLIPRRDGDTDDPKGGVRGVIPGKRGY